MKEKIVLANSLQDIEYLSTYFDFEAKRLIKEEFKLKEEED